MRLNDVYCILFYYLHFYSVFYGVTHLYLQR
nr:MAG TPA_asm: hypothetical protein [Caudoviricetes sp.]DAU95317.1 MAG TPA: hypothetical protein [Caudoviricetes sp.]